MLLCQCNSGVTRTKGCNVDYIYIDNSNLYIEGRRVSAVAGGLAPSIIDAMNTGTLDHGYTMSFGKLHEFLTGNDLSKIKRVALFGSRPPPNDSIWRHAKTAGFELHLEDRNYANKEKKIDTGIATLMTKDAYKHGDAKRDLFVLVAGDKDYVPTLNELTKDGYQVEVVFWNHASTELKKAASKFIALDPHLELLRL
ncbi:MAG: NYN domain-containing protein [Dongiaceae bacterium]